MPSPTMQAANSSSLSPLPPESRQVFLAIGEDETGEIFLDEETEAQLETVLEPAIVDNAADFVTVVPSQIEVSEDGSVVNIVPLVDLNTELVNNEFLELSREAPFFVNDEIPVVNEASLQIDESLDATKHLTEINQEFEPRIANENVEEEYDEKSAKSQRKSASRKRRGDSSDSTADENKKRRRKSGGKGGLKRDMKEYRARVETRYESSGPMARDCHVKSLEELSAKVSRCTVQGCCNNKFHCPLCPPKVFLPTREQAVMKHLRSHWRIAIKYGDVHTVRCYHECPELPEQSHWHCPRCTYCSERRVLFVRHLQRHEEADSRKLKSTARVPCYDENSANFFPEMKTSLPVYEDATVETCESFLSNTVIDNHNLTMDEVMATNFDETLAEPIVHDSYLSAAEMVVNDAQSSELRISDDGLITDQLGSLIQEPIKVSQRKRRSRSSLEKSHELPQKLQRQDSFEHFPDLAEFLRSPSSERIQEPAKISNRRRSSEPIFDPAEFIQRRRSSERNPNQIADIPKAPVENMQSSELSNVSERRSSERSSELSEDQISEILGELLETRRNSGPGSVESRRNSKTLVTPESSPIHRRLSSDVLNTPIAVSKMSPNFDSPSSNRTSHVPQSPILEFLQRHRLSNSVPNSPISLLKFPPSFDASPKRRGSNAMPQSPVSAAKIPPSLVRRLSQISDKIAVAESDVDDMNKLMREIDEVQFDNFLRSSTVTVLDNMLPTTHFCTVTDDVNSEQELLSKNGEADFLLDINALNDKQETYAVGMHNETISENIIDSAAESVENELENAVATAIEVEAAEPEDDVVEHCDEHVRMKRTDMFLPENSKEWEQVSEMPSGEIDTNTAAKPLENGMICDNGPASSSNLLANSQSPIKVAKVRILTVHKCKVCGEVLPSRKAYCDHTRTVHGVLNFGQLKVACEVCGTFVQTKNLASHMRTVHEGVKSHVCGTCDKSFAHKNSYLIHLDTHKQSEAEKVTRKHECSHCGKRYVSKYKLQEHMNFHENRRPYRCKVCDKAFPCRSALKKHRTVHEPESHTCFICDKTFRSLDYLKYHLSNHPGQVHKCTKCDSPFPSRSALKVHEQHCGDFACEICGMLFDNFERTKDHIMANHVSRVDEPKTKLTATIL